MKFINFNCEDKVTHLINEADMVHILLLTIASYGQLWPTRVKETTIK